jgi:hypothetical protein
VKIVDQSHVTETEIERLVHGDLEEAEVRRIVRHLSRCRGCRQRPRLPWLAAVLSGAEAAPEPLDPATEAAYDRAIDAALAKAAEEIPRRRRHAELVARLVDRQRELPPFRLEDLGLWLDPESAGTPAEILLEALLAASHEMRYRDPRAMLELAEAASRVAIRLDRPDEAKGRTKSQIADLQVRTLAELANAYRRNYKFDAAGKMITDALQALEAKGSGDPMLRARLYDVRASLRMDQRQLGEALDLLDLVHTSYLELGESHLAGRALIKKGIASAYADDPLEAARLLRQGLGMIDAVRDPMLATNGQFETLHSFIDSGDFQEASRFLLQSGLGKAFAKDPIMQLKLRWLEGKIFAGVNKLRRAEKILAEVRQGFIRRDCGYEAAVVGLELAAVYLRQRKAGRAEELAVEALETFQDLNVAYEARKAVLHLRKACRQKLASAALVSSVIRFLQKLERDPTLRFVPG